MDKIQDMDSKPQVSSSQKKRGVLLFSIAIILIVGSYWLGIEKEEETNVKQKKSVVTASQVGITESPMINLPPVRPVEKQIKQLEPLKSQEPMIFAKENEYQKKLEHQAIIAKMEAAQMRINSPTEIYKSKPIADVSVTSNANNDLSDPNMQFGNTASSQEVEKISATQESDTDWKIFQGKTIPAVLDTAINSDLPAMIRANISEDVYSETGRNVLLPKGTRLIGQYNSAIQMGQTRVFVIWTRAITPDQVSIALGSPGIDTLGRAGMAGEVDNHFWDIFGASLLLSVLAVGASDIQTPNSDTFYGNPYQFEVVESLSEQSDKILSERLKIKPTIVVDQGERINVMVSKDLDFSSLKTSTGNIVYNP